MKAELTTRQVQVLAKLAEGHQRQDVAREMGLAEDTIKCHAKTIFNKLGASNAAHAVALAFRAGVLQ
jgi:DNA-binding NarL/FixJ family response regulator